MQPMLAPELPAEFVLTPYLDHIAQRALNYLNAGLPVHFRGPAGTGKSTLAMYIASKISRPVILIYGNDDYTPSDLVGGLRGYKTTRVEDNFIQSVLKTSAEVNLRWVDGVVTQACRQGYTMIYDEFSRSRPEANNILLSLLEEKILELPKERNGQKYLKAHSEFRAIFTSNPKEYAGVHKTQDALRDRMITIDLDNFDEETELAITVAKSGLDNFNASRVVRVVSNFRSSDDFEIKPTIRASIMIAKVLKSQNASAAAANSLFVNTCQDILFSEISRGVTKGETKQRSQEVLSRLIAEFC